MLLSLLMLIILVAIGYGFLQSFDQQTARTEPLQVDFKSSQASTAPNILDIPLIDDHGATTSLRKLDNKWIILFFGFMKCPNICPTSLAYMAQEMKRLESIQSTTRVVFVSLDPKRDTPEALGAFVKNFDPNFV